MTDMIALARRAVACKGWRWMPGVVGTFPSMGERLPFWVVTASRDRPAAWSAVLSHLHIMTDFVADHPDALPDLTSPATLGCLLQLVRDAWGTRLISMAMGVDDGARIWRCYADAWDTDDCLEVWYPSEAEALVLALEKAP